MSGLKGLLKNVGGKIKNAAQSPVGTGLLGAAAFGFNPLLGLLAAPAIRSDRERQARSSEMGEMQLNAARRQEAGLKMLPGLIGPDPRGEAQRPGDMPIPLPPEMIQARDRERFSTLLDIAPEAAVGGLLGQYFPEQGKSPVRDLEMMGTLGFPLTQEGFAQYQAMRNSGSSDIRDQVAAIQAQVAAANLARQQREESEQKQLQVQSRKTAEFNTRRAIDSMFEAAELNEELRGTLLESGTPFVDFAAAATSGWASVRNLMGIEETKAKRLVTAYNSFQKLNSGVILESLRGAAGSADSGGVGRITNDIMGLVESSLGGISVDPDTNKMIYADSIERLLHGADVEDFGFDRNRYTNRLQKLRSPPSVANERIDLGGGVVGEVIAR